MADERVHPETVGQWRAWLAERHAASSGVWLVSWKAHTRRPAVSYDDAVTEALAVGWVDSVAGTVDEDRRMQRFTPRRPASGWSRSNKIRVQRLYAEDRMRPAGQRAIDLAKDNGAWTLLDDVEDLVVPEDLAEAFQRHAGSREQWDAFPPSARKAALAWIVQARRAPTRGDRVERTAAQAAEGKRAP